MSKAKESVETQIKETAAASEAKETKRSTGYAALIHAPNAKKVKALINTLKTSLQVIEVTSPGIEEAFAALKTKDPELLVGIGDQFLAPTADVKNERWGALTARAANLRKACETAAGLHERTGKKIKTQIGKQAVVRPAKPKQDNPDGEETGEKAKKEEEEEEALPKVKKTTKAKKGDAAADEAESEAVEGKAAKKATAKKSKAGPTSGADSPKEDKKTEKSKEPVKESKSSKRKIDSKKSEPAASAPATEAEKAEPKKKVWKP